MTTKRNPYEFELLLRSYLGQQGYSQKDLAAQLFIDRSTLTRWINGSRHIPFTELKYICKILRLENEEQAALFKAAGYGYDHDYSMKLLTKFSKTTNDNAVLQQQFNVNLIKHSNPYIVGAVIHNLEQFFGREQLMTQIIHAMYNNHVAIAGPRRGGKSSLLSQLFKKLKSLSSHEYCFIPILFDLQTVTQNEFFDKLMRALLRTLKELYPNLALTELIYSPKANKYDNHDFEDDLHEILAGLAQLMSQEIKFILLVDEGDKINEYDLTMQGKIRGLLSNNQCLKMVWTGVNIMAMANQASSPWYNMQISYTLPPLNETEAKQLIIEPAQRLGYTYQIEVQERILSYAKGQPYIIQYVCYRAVEEMLKEQRPSGEITLADVEIAITALAQELASQDKDNVVYQNIQEHKNES